MRSPLKRQGGLAGKLRPPPRPPSPTHPRKHPKTESQTLAMCGAMAGRKGRAGRGGQRGRGGRECGTGDANNECAAFCIYRPALSSHRLRFFHCARQAMLVAAMHLQ